MLHKGQLSYEGRREGGGTFVRTWQTGLIIDSMAFSLTQFLRNLITLGILVVRWHQPMHY